LKKSLKPGSPSCRSCCRPSSNRFCQRMLSLGPTTPFLYAVLLDDRRAIAQTSSAALLTHKGAVDLLHILAIRPDVSETFPEIHIPKNDIARSQAQLGDGLKHVNAIGLLRNVMPLTISPLASLPIGTRPGFHDVYRVESLVTVHFPNVQPSNGQVQNRQRVGLALRFDLWVYRAETHCSGLDRLENHEHRENQDGGRHASS
jgi:hypothetical protein